jgi:hypothetical protein
VAVWRTDKQKFSNEQCRASYFKAALLSFERIASVNEALRLHRQRYQVIPEKNISAWAAPPTCSSSRICLDLNTISPFSLRFAGNLAFRG